MRPKLFQEAIGTRSELRGSGSKHTKRRNLVDGVAEISAQCGFERANCELVHAKSAEQRVAANFLHQVFVAGNDSCLRTAEEFVATKDHQ